MAVTVRRTPYSASTVRGTDKYSTAVLALVQVQVPGTASKNAAHDERIEHRSPDDRVGSLSQRTTYFPVIRHKCETTFSDQTIPT